jgi:hypothetical protein
LKERTKDNLKPFKKNSIRNLTEKESVSKLSLMLN